MIRIEKARLLFLDVGPVEQLLKFGSEGYAAVSRVLDTVYERKIQMVASPITLMKVAEAAFAFKMPQLARQYREFFTRSERLLLREVDADVALAAAEFRAKFALEIPESVQLATAYVSGADVVLTTRKTWGEMLDAEVVELRELQG